MDAKKKTVTARPLVVRLYYQKNCKKTEYIINVKKFQLLIISNIYFDKIWYICYPLSKERLLIYTCNMDRSFYG